MRTSLLLALLTLVSLSAPASAQPGFMPFVGYNLEDEDFFVGVGARFGLPLDAPAAIALQPSVEYEFAGEDLDVFQIDANAIIEFTGSPSIAPYAGLGLGFTVAKVEGADSENELGLNAVGGIVLNQSGFGQPFLPGPLRHARGLRRRLLPAGRRHPRALTQVVFYGTTPLFLSC